MSTLTQDAPYIENIDTKKINLQTTRVWLQEAWMHHKELSFELNNLKILLQLKDKFVKGNIEHDIIRNVYDANIHIDILQKKYYKNFEMMKLSNLPMKSLISNYLSYNEELKKRVEKLMSKAKFSYN